MVYIAPSWCTSTPYTVVVVYNVPWVNPHTHTHTHTQMMSKLFHPSETWGVMIGNVPFHSANPSQGAPKDHVHVCEAMSVSPCVQKLTGLMGIEKRQMPDPPTSHGFPYKVNWVLYSIKESKNVYENLEIKLCMIQKGNRILSIGPTSMESSTATNPYIFPRNPLVWNTESL